MTFIITWLAPAECSQVFNLALVQTRLLSTVAEV
jgi:hypothetical protein